MVDEAVFRSVKRACYAGLDSVTLRTEVAERMRRAVAFDAHAFGTADPDTGLLNHLVAERIPAPLAIEYADELYPLHSAAFTIDSARAGSPVFRAGSESPAIAAVERANGFHFGIDVLLAADRRLWGKWCLLRESRGSSDVSRELALLRRLVPHLSRGLQQATLVDAALERESNATSAAGVVMFDARGRSLARSSCATPMLDDLADVGVACDGGIPLSILMLATRLQELARRSSDGIAETTALRARGRSGRWYLIQASLAEANAQAVPVTAVVIRPMMPREMAPMLTTLYGLSPRERDVIAGVVRGDTTKEIAARLGLSPHTVKHHLDRACEKTGARGRRALIARLFRDAYRPTLMT